ncbi:flagellar protein [Paenibacillus swuensis]|uniref:Flagellar protein n=1 Tax=Paenibacillus swuensis TaxID=1178515 RepID=A0A172TQ19_9BACL|nr:flagellar protein [Paenibacillus swuensis]
MNVANCPKCGRVYAKNFRDICPNCYKEVELQYEKCVKYLREYRKCTLSELNEATGVSVHQIAKFIREGRISLTQAPNLAFPCEICGTDIQTGTICEGCRKKLLTDVNNMNASEQLKSQPNSKNGYGYKIGD